MKTRSRITALLPLLLASAAAEPLPRTTPEAAGVASGTILDLVTAADGKVDTMHSLMILRHGEVLAEGWWKPEAADKPHVMFSVTKSFTSTAVGLAIADGKLKLDDPVLKFFPADAPAEPSENLKAMTVRDLLTMTCGHDAEPKMTWNAPTVKEFLAHPVTHPPGTYFKYNTPGSHVLSAIVTKVTGMTARDYLTPRLFEPLGIEVPRWDASPDGISIGGYGLFLKTEDVAKFGQLYLQKGEWQGKQLIPREWVEQATAKQVSNAEENRTQGPDWRQGYGYHFWRCQHDAYRADGAQGQFCVVFPGQDAVLASTSQTGDMQGELNVIWDFLPAGFQAEALAPDPAGVAKLKQATAALVAKAKPEGK